MLSQSTSIGQIQGPGVMEPPLILRPEHEWDRSYSKLDVVTQNCLTEEAAVKVTVAAICLIFLITEDERSQWGSHTRPDQERHLGENLGFFPLPLRQNFATNQNKTT